jgi:hypothetical protein
MPMMLVVTVNTVRMASSSAGRPATASASGYTTVVVVPHRIAVCRRMAPQPYRYISTSSTPS